MFLSPSKICENLKFSTEIQIFANFCWVIRVLPISVLKSFLLYPDVKSEIQILQSSQKLSAAEFGWSLVESKVCLVWYSPKHSH